MFTKEETEAMRKKYRYYSVIEGIGINFITDNYSVIHKKIIQNRLPTRNQFLKDLIKILNKN